MNGSANTSYVFSGDANGDAATGNDLIYIPRDIVGDELQPLTFTVGDDPDSFTAAEQAAAFEAYIQQDDYLSNHRGAVRASAARCSYPVVKRVDLSITQDVFHTSAATGTPARFGSTSSTSATC